MSNKAIAEMSEGAPAPLWGNTCKYTFYRAIIAVHFVELLHQIFGETRHLFVKRTVTEKGSFGVDFILYGSSIVPNRDPNSGASYVVDEEPVDFFLFAFTLFHRIVYY